MSNPTIGETKEILKALMLQLSVVKSALKDVGHDNLAEEINNANFKVSVIYDTLFPAILKETTK